MTTTDPDFRQDIADAVLRLPVAAAFGLTFTALAAGRAQTELAWRPEHSHTPGAFQANPIAAPAPPSPSPRSTSPSYARERRRCAPPYSSPCATSPTVLVQRRTLPDGPRPESRSVSVRSRPRKDRAPVITSGPGAGRSRLPRAGPGRRCGTAIRG